MPLPPLIIEAPPIVASRRSGLLVAATGPMPLERHAETSGARWWSNACGSAHLYPPACSESPYTAFTEDAASGLEDAFPVVVYSSIKCPAVGKSLERARAEATARLEASEQRAVEAALWGGQAAGPAVPGIFTQMTGDVTLLAGTAASAKVAVSALEQQSAQSNYDGPTILHARPGVAAYVGGAGLLRSRVPSDGERQFTHYGSEVSFGAGYAGSSPDGVTPPDATTEYMAITGRVFVWRSEIFHQEGGASEEPGLNKTTNQRTVIAFRVYAVGVECFAAMIKFTRA